MEGNSEVQECEPRHVAGFVCEQSFDFQTEVVLLVGPRWSRLRPVLLLRDSSLLWVSSLNQVPN